MKKYYVVHNKRLMLLQYSNILELHHYLTKICPTLGAVTRGTNEPENWNVVENPGDKEVVLFTGLYDEASNTFNLCLIMHPNDKGDIMVGVVVLPPEKIEEVERNAIIDNIALTKNREGCSYLIEIVNLFDEKQIEYRQMKE